jgi:hypothetical protein
VCNKLTEILSRMLWLKVWHLQSQEDRRGRGFSLSSRRLSRFRRWVGLGFDGISPHSFGLQGRGERHRVRGAPRPAEDGGEGESGSRMGDWKGFDHAWLTKLPVTGAVSGGPVASPDPGLASWP